MEQQTSMLLRLTKIPAWAQVEGIPGNYLSCYSLTTSSSTNFLIDAKNIMHA
ncbi:conserved hypothetical protein [Ricinus communis]|uniref:Uncharacterized protein n=1 Tax=Ricinus communis TaxID=3988 RepID=B9RIF5_RICCO|nr:conserved hypothetical protein [Ricinus communis]